MNTTRNSKRIFQRIGAVLAGLLAIFALSIGTDAVLHATGVLPPLGQGMSHGQALLALAYRIVFAVAGCYIAARLAPDRPMQHAYVLGIVGTVLGIAGAAATWNAGPAFEPKWYPLVLIVVAMPCAWAGGKLHETRAATRRAT